MACLPRPKLFRKRKKDKNKDSPNIVQRFFTQCVVLITSCVSTNTDTTKHRIDPDTRRRIVQRIIKRNKINNTAEFDIGTSSTSSNQGCSTESSGTSSCAQSKTDNVNKEDENEFLLLDPAKASKKADKDLTTRSRSLLFLEMFGKAGKSEYTLLCLINR